MDENRAPKGYRVTVYLCQPGWYDIRVFKRGEAIPILSTSGTMFESREVARRCGNRRAWDIAENKTSWS